MSTWSGPDPRIRAIMNGVKRYVEGSWGDFSLAENDAVDALDAIGGGEPDADHGTADDILLAAASPRVRAAYQRLQDRAEWWATA